MAREDQSGGAAGGQLQTWGPEGPSDLWGKEMVVLGVEKEPGHRTVTRSLQNLVA